MYDPAAIKLFGKTIPSPSPETTLTQSPLLLNEHTHRGKQKPEATYSPREHSCKTHKSYVLDNAKQDLSQDPTQEIEGMVDAQPEKDQLQTDCDGQVKLLKKPEKIVPCPRCNSKDTKFCYYNNYNVNQPRHFCKNCQRYWTAGGTMRSVPIGAGRRKNKHIASQYRHIIMLPDGIPTTQVDTPDSAHHQVNSCDGNSAVLRTSSGDGTVLKSGSDAPLCESMASVLNLGDQKREVQTAVVVCGGNGEEPSSCESFVSGSTCKIELPRDPAQVVQCGVRGCSDVPTPAHLNPLQCHPGQPLVYPWNSGWHNAPAIVAGGCSSETFYRLNSDDPKQVQWGSTSMVVAPTFCTPGMPFPFVPASYWGCMGSGWAGGWSMPWTAFHGTQSPSSSSSRSGCSNSSSPTLGKHSRGANIRGEGEDKTEKCLWVPKTLRIDHPDEAAKSSMWDTLDIKPSQSQLFAKGGIFKAFQPKTEVDDNASNAAQVLQANPAASSRSQAFQDST